jgi:hypothetical protein
MLCTLHVSDEPLCNGAATTRKLTTPNAPPASLPWPTGNFGTVFLDQAYWQAAIAAKPGSSHKGYLLGGLCWFTIPFALATSLGLAAVAMQLPLTSAEAGSGLVSRRLLVQRCSGSTACGTPRWC